MENRNRELLREELYNLCTMDDSTQGDIYFGGDVTPKYIEKEIRDIGTVIDFDYTVLIDERKPKKKIRKIIKKTKNVTPKLTQKDIERINREEKELKKLNEELKREKEKEEERIVKLEAERMIEEKEEEKIFFFDLEKEKEMTQKATKYIDVALREMREGKAKREYGYGMLYVKVKDVIYFFYLNNLQNILYIQPNVCRRFFYSKINDENVKAYYKYFKGGK